MRWQRSLLPCWRFRTASSRSPWPSAHRSSPGTCHLLPSLSDCRRHSSWRHSVTGSTRRIAAGIWWARENDARVVGLYVDPPAHAIVLSVDEKSHVWMAPGSQEESGRRRRIACGHVSGLLLRPAWPLAPMGVRGRSLIRSSGLRPFSSPGLSDPSMQPTTQSLSHASFLVADGVRRWRSADTVLPSPSRPRRYGPFCWRAPPRPSAGRSEPEGSGSTDSPSPPSSATTLSAPR